MLKGHVFSKQIFGNPIFALFIDTFLNGKNGVSNNYKNGMQVTYSGSNLNINSGAVCIQGRFLEEDTGSTVVAGTDTAYCKLVIEINLNLQNTESQFNQGIYKVVKSATGYPNLTQTNIVKNNAGIYQYELARFKTSLNGITDFQDMRTFLDFDSIYSTIEKECKDLLQKIEQELDNIEDGSAYYLKDNIAVLSAFAPVEGIPGSISYPSGFTKDNCYIVTINIIDNNNSLKYTATEVRVSLNDSNISIENNGLPENTKIKVVLMKI